MMEDAEATRKELQRTARQYLFHNLIGHPLMSVLGVLGCHDLAEKAHNRTLPKPPKKHLE